MNGGEKVLSALRLRVVRFGNDEVVRDMSHRDASRSALAGQIREMIEREKE